MTNIEKYYHLKENGICTVCGKNAPEDEKTKCRICAERATKRQKDNYYSLKNMGICTKCSKEKADDGYTTCLSCRMELREYKKQQYKQYMKKEEKRKRKSELQKERYERLKENGLCVYCGEPAENNKVLCAKCNYKTIIRRRKRSQKNAGIDRSERPNYGECYVCGSPICEESKKLCERCLENSRKAIRKALENPTQGMLEQRERWKRDNRYMVFRKKITEEMKTS